MARLAALLMALPLACTGHHRLEAVQRLSDDGKELYGRYKQFMTEGQQDEFLALSSDEDRRQWLATLKIEERLARYPQFIQDAIWSQEVVPGMDREAVLLTWSVPLLREWDDDEMARGNEIERWSYRRDDRYVQVVLTNGVVTQVLKADGAL